jgi:hypothetical protein
MSVTDTEQKRKKNTRVTRNGKRKEITSHLKHNNNNNNNNNIWQNTRHTPCTTRFGDPLNKKWEIMGNMLEI